MGLNVSKGNMYSWITHTFNAIKGQCPHNCTYCYMKRWGKQNKLYLDRREFKTDLGSGNFIFVGSSCDMFAADIPPEWIVETLDYCRKFDNRYLFQSKNPQGMAHKLNGLNAVLCTTIETNRWYPDVMQYAPKPELRAIAMDILSGDKYVTIEPIMDFDLAPMVELIRLCNPKQVNIGADSDPVKNKLPEPSIDKVKALIAELSKFTVISQKRNLERLMRNA